MVAMQQHIQQLQQAFQQQTQPTAANVAGEGEAAKMTMPFLRTGVPTAGMTMMSEDMEKRIKKIEEYLEKIPGIDENVLNVLAELRGVDITTLRVKKPAAEQTADGEESEVTVSEEQPAKAEGEDAPKPEGGEGAETGAAGATVAAPKKVEKAAAITGMNQESMNKLLANSPFAQQMEQMQQLMMQTLAMVRSFVLVFYCSNLNVNIFPVAMFC
jgi:hypothetical protein